MITWRETRERLRRDRERLVAHLAAPPGARPRALWTNPSWQCVVLQRLAYYWYGRGWRLLGRFFWHLDLLLTGADIAMVCDLGPGLLILVPCGCCLACSAGRDLTLIGLAGLGGGTQRTDDLGGGPGVPVAGDGVEIGWSAVVLGPVRIGDGARLGALSLVTRDVAAGAQVPDGARWTRSDR